MTEAAFAERAAELARSMAAIAARLPRDWHKEHPPANPACEATASMGEQQDG
jgi:hypothetical protein